MSTIGVYRRQDAPILPPCRNMHLYNYTTTGNHLKPLLASVQESKVNVNLPPLRRTDEELYGNELTPFEVRLRCRKLFDRWTSTMQRDYSVPPLWIDQPKNNQTVNTYHQAWDILRNQGCKEELRDTRLAWTKFLDRCPERMSLSMRPNFMPSELSAKARKEDIPHRFPEPPLGGYANPSLLPYDMRGNL